MRSAFQASRPRNPEAGSKAISSFSLILVASYGPSLINFRGPLIEAMVARGWSVYAAAPDLSDESIAALKALGAEPVQVRLARTGMNPLSDIAYFAELRTLFGRLRPDVVLSYTAKPVIWGALAAKAAGVPRFAALITGLGFAFADSDRSTLRQGLARFAASLLYRSALDGADCVLFQNPDDQSLFADKGFLRGVRRVGMTAGSGVDLARFSPADVPEAPVFLMTSRLLIAKGVREYAAAAARLRKTWPGARFQLAGYLDGGSQSVSQSELDGWIVDGLEFLGRLEDVRPALAAASVFVLPSYYREGQPRTILEAMAMGRAIVTTDSPGCRETVTEGVNGYLVPPRDPAALAEAMARFLIDPALVREMGRASLKIARERYDVTRINAQILAVLEPVSAGERAVAPTTQIL